MSSAAALRDVAELSGLTLHLISRFEQGLGGMSLKKVMHVPDILGLRLRVEAKKKPE